MADSDDLYFSEQERGVVAQNVDHISGEVWNGLRSFFRTIISRHQLAEVFPEVCPDLEVNLPYETDERALSEMAAVEIPGLQWPLHLWEDPDDFAVLDAIQFFGKHVSRPRIGGFHDFFKHHHFIGFDREPAFVEYRATVNRLFRRNGIAYQLDEDGRVSRILPGAISPMLSVDLMSGDEELDAMIQEAVTKFKEPDLAERKLGLERLWDAWERLKTIHDPDKRKGWFKLRDEKFIEAHLRDTVEEEAIWLTKIGNEYQIRHKEVGKHPIDDPKDIDYLFFRMYSLIYRILRP